MADWGRNDLRRFVTQVLDAFIAAMEPQRGQPVTLAALQQTARALEASPTFDASVNATYARIKDAAAKEIIRNRRTQPFKRLMVHPLTELFQTGQMNRYVLANYFNFLHLVLGDETEALSRLCVTICKDKGDEDGVDWGTFYEDERAKYVLWTVLLRIAASFRKFDARRDWFINLMQTRQTSASLASNAFVPLPVDNQPDEPQPFGAEEFNLMFAALYAPLRHLGIEDQAHFSEALRTTPEQAFGEMWVNLERVGAEL